MYLCTSYVLYVTNYVLYVTNQNELNRCFILLSLGYPLFPIHVLSTCYSRVIHVFHLHNFHVI